jgi:hypothetical protein
MLIELKRALRRRIPRAYDQVAGLTRWLVDPYERLLCRIGRRTGWRVAAGPFSGMRYIRRHYGDRWAPRLIGCYEEELHPELERALNQPVRYVVNIGSGDGYYAVGIALRLPNARIIAYDLTPMKQESLAELSTLNGVRNRIDIRGACSAQQLSAEELDSALVLCDCEGAEEDILDPQIVPWLRRATMIVELHPFYRHRVIEILTERFRESHDLKIIEEQQRDPARYTVLAGETPENSRWAVKEERVVDGRPAKTPWGIWTPRSTKST